MQLKSQKRRPRAQMLYARRSHTFPLFLNPVGTPGRAPSKSIKSLNVFCLARIFDFLDYQQLFNCRLVCSFWNESVDFHLNVRTHFAYGKAYNVLPDKKSMKLRKKKTPIEGSNNIVLNTNLMFACEKCLIINRKMRHENARSYQLKRCASISQSSPSNENDDCESTSSASSSSSFDDTPCLSVSRSPSSPPPLLEDDFDDDELKYRCTDCQAMLREFHLQLQKEMKEEEADEEHTSEAEEYYAGSIDEININILERILVKMPRLVSLKFAEGYHYGRLRQSCLEVSGVDLIERTFHFCPNLIRLDLSNCVGLDENDFVRLVKLFGKQLLALNVSGTRIDEKCLRVIVKGCDRLRYLNVANNFCGLKGGCFEWLSDSIETIVADYNQNVRLLDGLLQGKGREIIELELNVGYCFNAAMPYKLIGNHFHDLISLKVTFKSFGPRKHRTFVGLSQLRELECLYLIEEIDDFDSESSLDDDSVLPIMQNCGGRLRELALHCASSLFGRSSSLTDSSIAHIDTLCPLLEVFSIKRASITDISLRSIARLKNAFSVHLIDLENISERGVTNIMHSFKQIETQELENIKQSSGVDLSVSSNGPKIEKKELRRHGSLTAEMEAAVPS